MIRLKRLIVEAGISDTDQSLVNMLTRAVEKAEKVEQKGKEKSAELRREADELKKELKDQGVMNPTSDKKYRELMQKLQFVAEDIKDAIKSSQDYKQLLDKVEARIRKAK